MGEVDGLEEDEGAELLGLGPGVCLLPNDIGAEGGDNSSFRLTRKREGLWLDCRCLLGGLGKILLPVTISGGVLT